jgi:hypothetical protein
MTGDEELRARADYLFDEDQAGTLLHSERTTPSPRAWAIIVGILALVFLAQVPTAGARESAITTALYSVFYGVFIAGNCLYKHEVRSRALLTGLSWPGARPYIIPWVFVDPNKIRLQHRSYFLEGQPQVPLSWTYRFAPWNLIVVSIPGLPPRLAHPRGADRETELRRRWCTDPKDYPTVPWHLGTRNPEQLLRAIERALVGAGKTDARGLAARELAAYAARAAERRARRWRRRER